MTLIKNSFQYSPIKIARLTIFVCLLILNNTYIPSINITDSTRLINKLNKVCRRCFSVWLWPLARRSTLGSCDHSQTPPVPVSQTLITQCLSSPLSEWLLTRSRFRQTPSGGVWTHSFVHVRASYIRARTCHVARVRSRSLSFLSRLWALSLSSAAFTLLEPLLFSSSLSRRARRLASLQRSSRFFSLAAEPPFTYNVIVHTRMCFHLSKECCINVVM